MFDKFLLPEGKLKNHVFSPFSLAILLDIIKHYCEGTDLYNDLIQFLEQLNYDKETAIKLIQEYENSSTTFLSNNVLFHEQKYPYNKIDYPNFSQFSEDFAQRPALHKKINTWVSKQTKGLIKEIIVPDDPRLIAMLINAIYLKAEWIKEFESPQHPLKFTLLNGKEKKTGYLGKSSLTGEEPVYYYEAESYRALRIPYKDERLCFEIYLPTQSNGLPSLIKELETSDLYQLSSKFEKIDKYYYIFPKFEIKNTLDLKETLCSLGLEKLFAPNKVEALQNAPSPFSIDAIIQQNFIKVNEKGTEAASVTYAMMLGSSISMVQPIEFKAEHPFIFIIRDTIYNSIIYIGTLTEPPAYDGPNYEEDEDEFPKKLSWWQRLVQVFKS
ncbi:MAG: serpin family protein [Aureispira sp.]|nr:serpin family protein [Aureispira sp.]